MERPPQDIVSLRIAHCRAERAAVNGQYHLAVQQYRACLESAERREDCQAMQFFALKLADMYTHMGYFDKAASFRALGRAGGTATA